MRIHILGIGGTFMAGIALLAREMGHDVVGSDQALYPPMNVQLANAGIRVHTGYDPAILNDSWDTVIIGNVMRRGNPMIETLLNQNIPYTSGPQWLADHILKNRWVLAVAGTHGKTTTSSLLAWILVHTGKDPGYLIGGIPENMEVSARCGSSSFFVIEADEYDSAFFDKRSKFLHYHPRTVILNNLEYDHADIFPDLAAIQQSFHYLIRTIPGNGLIVYNKNDHHVQTVLEKGCWTPVTSFGNEQSEWKAQCITEDGSHFRVIHQDTSIGEVQWSLLGLHNVQNALAAIAAAHHAGIPPEESIRALPQFKNVKRRLEIKGKKNGITVYDDFAHHPTAIATTLQGLRARIGTARLMAVLQLGSYTMRTGVHKDTLALSLKEADQVYLQRPNDATWDIHDILPMFSQPVSIIETVDAFIPKFIRNLQSGDHILIMSNAGFDDIHTKILNAL